MNIATLLTKARQVKNETAKRANTAQRIGGLFEDMADAIQENSTAVEDLQERLTRSIDGTYNGETGELVMTWSDGNLAVQERLADGEIDLVY